MEEMKYEMPNTLSTLNADEKHKKEKMMTDETVVYRDIFSREKESTDRILSKSKVQLYDTMLEAKKPEMRLKLNEFWEDLKQMMDKKDGKINMLSTELVETIEQYQRRTQKNCEMIDYFQGAYKLFAQRFQREYEKEVQQLMVQFHIESQLFQRSVEDNLKQLDNIHDAMKLLTERYDVNMEKDLDQLRSQSVVDQQKYNTLTIYYKEKLQADMQSLLEAMNINFDLNKAESDYITMHARYVEQEGKSQNVDVEFHEKCKVLTELEFEMKKLQTESHAQMTELKHERLACAEELARLKSLFLNSEKSAKLQLQALIVDARKTTQILEQNLSNREHIIGIFHDCKKHETENQKFFPFTKMLDTHFEEKDSAFPDELNVPEVRVISSILSKYTVENIELEEEIWHLRREYNKLKTDLTTYFKDQRTCSSLFNCKTD